MTYYIKGSVSIQQSLYLGLLTTVQRTALVPTQMGATVYDTDEKLVYQWNGTTWVQVGSGSILDWATATNYLVGATVTNEGRIYRATTAHTSTTFGADRANWTVIVPLSVRDYQASTYYYAGDDITALGNLWSRTASGTSGAVFDLTEQALWTQKIVGVDIVAWAPSTAYEAGQLVTQGSGRILKSIASFTSGAVFDATEASNWTLIQTGPITGWVASTYYYANEMVKINERTVRRTANGVSGATFDITEGPLWTKISDDGAYYVFTAGRYYYLGDKISVGFRKVSRLTAGIAGATFDNTEAPLWQLVLPTAVSIWAASTYYYTSEQTISPAGALIRRNSNGISGATFDATEAGFWFFVATTRAFPWSASRVYFNQDWAITPSGNLAQNGSTRVSGTTFDATEAANWTVRVQGNLLPSWAASTWYYSGDQAQVNGVQYTRVANGTSLALFNASEKAFWRITAELNIPSEVSTQAKTASYTVADIDGVVSIAPIANMTITLPSTLSNDKEYHFAGAISTFTVTFTAGAGTTIVDPTTYLPVASFTMPGTVNQRYYLKLRKVGTVWCIS